VPALHLSRFRLSSNARKSYEDSLAEHWAVAVAIRRRDPDAAEHAMRTLLAGTARDLAPAYEGLKRRRRTGAQPVTAARRRSR
jgi:DNA-binding FadR family transcriptional regulator